MVDISKFKKFLIDNNNTASFAEESVESFILPEVLKDLPYLLDIFPFKPSIITYTGKNNITSYKTPQGINYNAFVKSDPMRITITDAMFEPLEDIEGSNTALFKQNYGLNVGSLDVMLFKFLGYQQTKTPIFLKTTKFVGPVLLESWDIKEASEKCFFNATLLQTSFRSLNQFNFQGQEGKDVIASSNKGMVGNLE